jgi:Tol biopolymer transport system component
VEIVGVDRTGGVRPLAVAPRSFGTMEVSPDGRHLAVALYEEIYQVLLVDVDTGRSRVLAEPDLVNSPVWSPDGAEILFSSRRDGYPCILAWAAAEPARPARLVYRSREDAVRLVLRGCTPDGGVLVLLQRAGAAAEFLRVPLAGSEPPETVPVPRGSFIQLSPDGRWLALTVEVSARPEIHVQRFSDGPLVQVSFAGGEEPRWSSRGDELYFRYGDTWMAVPVSTGQELRLGEPRELFRGPYSNVPGFSYAVAPGGDRFYVLRPVHPEQPVTQLHLVLNWADEVQRRLARSR